MNITQRKDGRWQKKITLPDGKTKYFYSKENTAKKAEKDITSQILNYEQKKHADTHNFYSIASQMLSNKANKITYNAYKGYEYSIKRLREFYNKDIQDITANDIMSLYSSMQLRGYSKDTISKTKSALIQIYKYAIILGVSVDISMITSISIPKNAPKTRVSAIDDKTLARISQHATPCDFSMWAFILMCTGLRRGELLALKKCDIDFENKEINVNKAIEYIVNQPNVKETKSYSGNRTVPIVDILYDLLYVHCKGLKKDDFIFGGEKPLTLTVLRRRWKNYCNIIECDMNMHQLRHSYAKTLYRSEVDAKTAQNLLGHANISITMDIYTEFAKDMTKKSTEKINAFFNSVS